MMAASKEAMLWYSTHKITEQCAACAHVLEEARMCCCDLGYPGFPRERICPEFDGGEVDPSSGTIQPGHGPSYSRDVGIS